MTIIPVPIFLDVIDLSEAVSRDSRVVHVILAICTHVNNQGTRRNLEVALSFNFRYI